MSNTVPISPARSSSISVINSEDFSVTPSQAELNALPRFFIPFHLHTFPTQFGFVKVSLDSSRSFQASLNGKEIELITPFSKNYPFLQDQINKLPLFLKTLSIQVNKTEDSFKAYLNPKLLGAGGCFSKQTDEPTDKALFDSPLPLSPTTPKTPPASSYEVDNPEQNVTSNSLQPATSSSIKDSSIRKVHFKSGASSKITEPVQRRISLSHIKNTQDLAYALLQTNPESNDYTELENRAYQVIEAFAAKHVLSTALILELTNLAKCKHARISQEILRVIFNRLHTEPLLDPELLIGLRDTLSQTEPEHLDADNLVAILKSICSKYETFHQQEATSAKLYTLLHTLSGVLDAMGDANVKKLSYDKSHDPLYKVLVGLSEHSELSIAAEAAYAKESLIRIPHNQTKLSLYVRRLCSGVKGLVDLGNVLSYADPSLLVSAYDQFKSALYSQGEKQSWYDELRPMIIMIEQGHFRAFEEFVNEKAEETANPCLVGGLIIALSKVIQTHPDHEIRQNCLAFLESIYLDDLNWSPLGQIPKNVLQKITKAAQNLSDKVYASALQALDKNQNPKTRNESLLFLTEQVANAADWTLASKVKVSLLQQFRIVATVQDKVLSEIARNTLKTIANNATKEREKAWLRAANIPQDLETLCSVKASALPVKIEASTTLISLSMNAPISTSTLLNRLRNQRLGSTEIKEELSTYIPPSGAVGPASVDYFDLENAIFSFFQGDKKTLLLLGGAGAGKSTFGKYLEQKLWDKWDSSKPIPLFIELPVLKNLVSGAIEETLKNYSFTDSQIHQLKANHQFIFILDGFDETGKKEINLYESNKLKEWKAKVIFSCRDEYIKGTSYQDWFSPYIGGLPKKNLFQELWVAPFSEKEIDAYLQKYVSTHQEDLAEFPEWQNWEMYKEQIVQIPGLMKLLSTPFILYITAESLPMIVRKHLLEKPGEQIYLVSEDLYRAFIDNWFDRQKGKLLISGKLQDIEWDIKEGFLHYSKKLADMMHDKQLIVIEYQPPSPWQKAPSEWEEFFGSNPPHMPLILSGIPLRKVGKNQFAFLHASLRDYLMARKGQEELMAEASSMMQ